MALPRPTMTPEEFIAKWRNAALKERSGSQEHFIDLCRLLGEPTPAEGDPTGESYCFERGARKDTGGAGWADVWKRHHFAWEYKGKHADLDRAFNQLRQYALALENPPLLIVSDMVRFRICTNWTNSVSQTHEIELDELADAAVRDKLKWAMSDPERLRPGETRQSLTERTASTFASLAQDLRERGYEPQAVAHFVNRMVFCMFAEDVGLLPNDMFTRMLQQAKKHPSAFSELAGDLFRTMAVGGRIGFESVEWFNGGLFDDDTALSLTSSEIALVLEAAALDWSEIDPSLLGTLFERGLDPDKRAQLGAHYTDRDKIMQIVDPVVIRPWQEAWRSTKAAVIACLERSRNAKSRPARTRLRGQAQSRLSEFLERLRSFVVLDPACGSGNFLYMALHALKDLEHQTQLEAEGLGFQRGFPGVGPANVKGLEISPYAAELARVSVWIGEIQWMRRNGFNASRDPILKPLETIECRDALVARDGSEANWPEADVVVGNPPFLGDKRMRGLLGDGYVTFLRALYRDRVQGGADLVCYWFAKAGQLIAEGKVQRAGLVATNSIRGGRNRKVLDRIVAQGMIFEAWSDESWVLDGAAVRVSLICFSDVGSKTKNVSSLNGYKIAHIYSDLTAGESDLTQALSLSSNAGVTFRGNTKGGPFDIPGELARRWLYLPVNPNGKTNADVLKPVVNGADLMGGFSDRWIIFFEESMSLSDAALYEEPFAHVAECVKPVRQRNRVKKLQESWWLHQRSRPAMWRALAKLPRYIATPEMSKHRVFAWLDTCVCPDHQLIVIARDDDTTFGILHSRFHEAWSLRLGTSLGGGPRYTSSTTFRTFPFPDGLSPNVSATEYATDSRAVTIAEAASRLVLLRDRWLYPPEWVEWLEEPVPGYPTRPVPRDAHAAALKDRTLTKLYNARPQWLIDAHAALDAAVAAAYGWPEDIAEDAALAALLALNLEQGSADTK